MAGSQAPNQLGTTYVWCYCRNCVDIGLQAFRSRRLPGDALYQPGVDWKQGIPVVSLKTHHNHKGKYGHWLGQRAVNATAGDEHWYLALSYDGQKPNQLPEDWPPLHWSMDGSNASGSPTSAAAAAASASRLETRPTGQGPLQPEPAPGSGRLRAIPRTPGSSAVLLHDVDLTCCLFKWFCRWFRSWQPPWQAPAAFASLAPLVTCAAV